MRYFIDTEFAERSCSIDLISIAIVAEDGREFYAESCEFRLEMANEWVRKNVVPKLWSRRVDAISFFEFTQSRPGNFGGLLHLSTIADAVRKFVGDDKPEFWGYYCDYDWVVFCWLFGSMIDLPKGWPMYCRDLKQLCDSLGNPDLPKLDESEYEHHALSDARWIRQVFNWLTGEEA
jgi:hypothetical protein